MRSHYCFGVSGPAHASSSTTGGSVYRLRRRPVSANGKALKPAKELKDLGKKAGFYFYDDAAKHLYINPGSAKTMAVAVKY